MNLHSKEGTASNPALQATAHKAGRA
jgi:hypothetical protein